MSVLETKAAKPAVDLKALAHQSMVDNGFLPDLPAEAAREVAALDGHVPAKDDVRDLRALPWSSIDNRESRDLDQIEVVEQLPGGDVRVMIGIADVDWLMPPGSALDAHAAHNTCSVYTGVDVFPMLPERLSCDLTSLNFDADRLAIVIELVVDQGGTIKDGDVYRALVRNRAKLAYEDVSAWLSGGAIPPGVTEVPGLERQLRIQNDVAQLLQALRFRHGALDLETIEARPVTVNGKIVSLAVTEKSHARELIEDFMIAANGAMARFFDTKKRSSIRRVVKSPERWLRIVALAKTHGATLPDEPDARALSEFLHDRKTKEKERFADLSLAVVKLMGPGEYALERASGVHTGHFGLATQDYTHSTAPNRRYADLVTQRLLKAALTGARSPYSDEELATLATRCTAKENDARKVERTMRKVFAAMLLSDRIGDEFDAIVTGATPNGTFVRLISPPAEGRIVRGEQGLDVGDELKVRLVATEPRKGFIDFARA